MQPAANKPTLMQKPVTSSVATNLRQMRDRITEFYGPQLGELAWHSVHVDGRVVAMSEQHAETILNVVERYRINAVGRPIRILEVGAYAHFGAHKAAAMLRGSSVVHDISPASLRLGLEQAHQAGLEVDATLVAGDFHDLPFSSGFFDIVFCASSVHHTFRPWKMLNEMLRVTRGGGALHLENEPVGRALSFYAFRSNREPEFTAFESKLALRGSLFTFSSPFLGSRPENLFGMTENDRIPLDLILDTLTQAGDIASLRLTPQKGEFEDRILALPRDVDLEARLATLLLAERQALEADFSQRDLLLGVRLPDVDEIWRLSYQVAPLLRRLTHLDGHEVERQTARVFGAALQATIIKRGEPEQVTSLFQKQVSMQDGVFDALPVLHGLKLQLNVQPIPAIEDGDVEVLASVYPRTEWEPYREENGLLSLLNLGACGRIALPGLDLPAILLLRFYAVAADKPYRVTLRLLDGTEINSLVVVQSESLLFREIVPEGCTGVLLETRNLEGEILSLARHVRLGVARLIPVGFD